MAVGEVKAKDAETSVIPLELGEITQTEFAEIISEIEGSVGENLTSNNKVKERFSRLKKSLRKRSVSIL
jgi:hypothetical protein